MSVGTTLTIFGPNDRHITKILECPVCFEIPDKQIWNCARGHVICDSCRKNLKKCALCRKDYVNSRNFALEEIISNSIFRCRYEPYGCKETMAGNVLSDHKRICFFRPMVCYLGSTNSCHNTCLFYSDYFNHLVSVHKVFYASEAEDPVVTALKISRDDKKTNYHWATIAKEFDKKVFLIRAFRVDTDMYWSVAIIGTDAEASQYTASISIEANGVDSYGTEVGVHSVSHSKLPVRRRYPHAKLTEKQLKSFRQNKSSSTNSGPLHLRTEYTIFKVEI